jgi:hypothetical protein
MSCTVVVEVYIYIYIHIYCLLFSISYTTYKLEELFLYTNVYRAYCSATVLVNSLAKS